MNFLNKKTPDILDCIADLSNDEIFTSPKLANQILDLLPKKIWENPSIKILDPSSKTGIFLRESAKRFDIGLKNKIKDKKKRAEHIFTNQLFGIAITEITSLISRRTVYYSKWANRERSVCKRFKNDDGNIYFKNYSHVWTNNNCKLCGVKKNLFDRDSKKESYAYPFLHDKIFKNMKFDVIIGNPPYQVEDGGHGKSASPIFQKFVDQAIKLNPTYLTMIIPARWYSGGKGLDTFREKMVNDDRISELHDFPETSDCFPGQNIRGGVCFFLWEKNYKGKTKIFNYKSSKVISEKIRNLKFNGSDLFIRYNEGIKILEKVKLLKEQTFEKIVSSRKPFGLPTNYDQFIQKKTDSSNIKLFRFGSDGYINPNQISTNKELINKYKVLVPYSSPGTDDYPHLILSKPFLSPPNTCCTETYLIVGPFKTKEICENVITYMKTRFFRFLILMLKNTQHVTKKNYQFVPIQNFDQSWNDKKLFKKYNINDSEIKFIESLVKPIE